ELFPELFRGVGHAQQTDGPVAVEHFPGIQLDGLAREHYLVAEAAQRLQVQSGIPQECSIGFVRDGEHAAAAAYLEGGMADIVEGEGVTGRESEGGLVGPERQSIDPGPLVGVAGGEETERYHLALSLLQLDCGGRPGGALIDLAEDLDLAADAGGLDGGADD